MSSEIEISKEKSEVGVDHSGDAYPYGTSLTLTDKMVDDLGLSKLKVGEKVTISAKAFVDSKSEHESSRDDYHSNKSVSLQLTTIKIDKVKDRVKTMYEDE